MYLCGVDIYPQLSIVLSQLTSWRRSGAEKCISQTTYILNIISHSHRHELAKEKYSCEEKHVVCRNVFS